MKWFRNPDVVKFTPFITTALLEAANVLQLIEMWMKRTAMGQSVWAWVSVNLALILWLNWYMVFTPDQRFAIWATRLGIGINIVVILTVLYFK